MTEYRVWRFQCDVAYGENDPFVTVFLGPVIEGRDNVISIQQDASNPLTMRLSDLNKYITSGVDHANISAKQQEEIEIRAAAKAEAERASNAERARIEAEQDAAARKQISKS